MNRSFLPRGILRDVKDFYNREYELNRIYNFLGKLLCVNVFGQRRIGKTWLLRKIYLDEVSRPPSLKTAIFIYWNLQDQQNLTIQQFMDQLIELTLRKLPLAFRQSYEQCISNQLYPEDHWNTLVELVGKQYRIVYLLDEFDAIITSKEFSPASFSLTRNIFQSDKNEFSTFLVSTYRAINDTGLGGYGSPFFNIFNKVGIGLFGEKDALEFIVDTFNQYGATITTDGLNEILGMTGFHPCFISQLCDELQSQYVDQSMELINIQDVKNLSNTFYTSVIDDYQYYWQHLNPRQRYTIQDIADGHQLSQDNPVFSNLTELVNLSLVVSKDGKYELLSRPFLDFVHKEHTTGIPVIKDTLQLATEYQIIEQEPITTGKSRIWKAINKQHNRLVAIKVIIDDYGENMSNILVDNLIREANIIAKIARDPNIGNSICQIHSLIIEKPVRLIMDWIEGEPLTVYAGMAAKIRLSEFEILTIGIKLAKILVSVHNQGICHRDLAPDNIILRQRDGLRQKDDPVLIDFDIARAPGLPTLFRSSDGNRIYLGKPRYSAPEQWTDPESVSSAADIFSLGVILYELFTGARPFDDGNRIETYGGELPIPQQRSEIPTQVYTIICECLRQDPKERPSAEILKAKLEQCGNQIGE